VQCCILRVGSRGPAGIEQSKVRWVDRNGVDRTDGQRFCKHWHAKNTAHLFGMRKELQRLSSSLLFDSGSSSGGCAPCKGSSPCRGSSSSGGCAPCGGSSISSSGLPVCQEEHEKNLSLMGVRVPPFSTVLVNLDVDNIVGRTLLAVVAEHATTHKMQGWVLQVHTKQGGATGQISYWARDWCHIRGYDQEQGILGSSYQHIDLRDRLKQLSKQVNSGHCTSHIGSLALIGIAVENLTYTNTKPFQDRTNELPRFAVAACRVSNCKVLRNLLFPT